MIDHEDARLQLADLIIPGPRRPDAAGGPEGARRRLRRLPRRARGPALRRLACVRAGGHRCPSRPGPSAYPRYHRHRLCAARRTGRAASSRASRTWRVATIRPRVRHGRRGRWSRSPVTAVAAPRSAPRTSRAMLTAAPYEGATIGTADGDAERRSGGAHRPVRRAAARSGRRPTRSGSPATRQARHLARHDRAGQAGKASVVLPVPAAAKGYQRVWVTNEPPDGNPRWTTDWIVRVS